MPLSLVGFRSSVSGSGVILPRDAVLLAAAAGGSGMPDGHVLAWNELGEWTLWSPPLEE